MPKKKSSLTATALSGDHVKALEDHSPGLGLSINSALAELSHQIAVLAGNRGPVEIAKQKKTDTKGLALPAMDMGDQRIANVADAKRDQDAVNLRQLRRLLPDAATDDELDPTDVQKAACQPTSPGHMKSVDSDLTGIYAVDAFGEHIVLQGGIVADNGHFRVYLEEYDNSLTLVGSLNTTEVFERMVNQGHIAYGCRVDGGSNNLTLVDWKRPDDPREVAVFNVGAQAFGLHVQGRWVYVATSNGVKIVDVSDPGAIKVKGTAS